MIMNPQRCLLFFTLMWGCSLGAVAQEIPTPKGVPILSISGSIGNTNTGAAAILDLQTIENLPQDSFTTKTPWHEGEVRFTGVRMDRLMERLEARGTRVTVHALNDYTTTIPIEDFKRFGVLLAFQRNGKYMSVRDKGPLFIIYPFDQHRELRSQTYFGRSAWQVSRIVVE